ncbi:MAG: NADH-quinone oxidoreductase subunit K [Burkholderiales bacterium]
MSAGTILGLAAAVLVGLGVYGLVVNAHPLRKILAFNVVGSGVFLLLGTIARRGAGAGLTADPVPQALLITGIVVAFSATAVAVAVLLRLAAQSDSVSLASEPPSLPTVADDDAPRD